MQRHQLIEIHELPCCPAVLRNGLTQFLALTIHATDAYGPIRLLLRKALQTSGSTTVVDLCSGAGGPWLSWHQEQADSISCSVTLTDRFPPQEVRKRLEREGMPGLAYHNQSIDATSVPATLPGLRTLFSSFHHFAPEQAKAILRDAVHQQQPIAIFELTERSWKHVLLMGLSFFGVLLFTARRPLTKQVLLWTYLLPIIPLLVTLDGIVSCLRTYTVPELQAMALETGTSFYWQTGRVRHPQSPIPITYLVGYPQPTTVKKET